MCAWDGGLGPGYLVNHPADLTCVDGPCEQLDHRDVAIGGSEAFIAEHGKGRILRRLLDKDHRLGQAQLWQSKWLDSLKAPSGIFVTAGTAFVTTDTPPPDSKASTSGTPVKGGALYLLCTTGDCKPTLVDGALHQPSGVVATDPQGPVYVADQDGATLRWPIYRNLPGRGWIQDGFLASAPASEHNLPVFLGIAFSPVMHMIFTAGPSGLYAFDVNGAAIGRMTFDEPVSGVAAAPDSLYLVVGQMLRRISFKALKEPKETKAALPERQLLQPVPAKHVPAESKCPAADNGAAWPQSPTKAPPQPDCKPNKPPDQVYPRSVSSRSKPTNRRSHDGYPAGSAPRRTHPSPPLKPLDCPCSPPS